MDSYLEQYDVGVPDLEVRNPYLFEHNQYYDFGETLMRWRPRAWQAKNAHAARRMLTNRYGWCMLNEHALHTIKEFVQDYGYNRVIDFGCGSGYNSWLLQQRGVRVVALDQTQDSDHRTEEGNDWKVRQNTYTTIILTDNSYKWLGQYQEPKDVLFLAWPPYDRDMAGTAIEHFLRFGGEMVFHVGEDNYGCTGGPSMWYYLDEKMDFVDEFEIPRWTGMHDTLQIYIKKG